MPIIEHFKQCSSAHSDTIKKKLDKKADEKERKRASIKRKAVKERNEDCQPDFAEKLTLRKFAKKD